MVPAGELSDDSENPCYDNADKNRALDLEVLESGDYDDADHRENEFGRSDVAELNES